MRDIFVFGSNRAGRHGAGAAKTALKEWGAVYGIGFGLTGDSYAIPTKDHNLKIMSLQEIKPFVSEFVRFARNHPNLNFLVTRIGTGLSKYSDEDIAPMFKGCPPNCKLHPIWQSIIEKESEEDGL